MAIYTINLNGVEIFNGWNKVEPKLHLELNAAGYLEFIDPMPNPTSEYAMLYDTYVVFEQGTPIFQGRPVESTRLYTKMVKHYIEGAYGYFNDSVVKPFVYNTQSISYDTDGGATLSASDMLAYIVGQHNAQVAQNRQIQVGTVTITGTLYRVYNYESCISALADLRDELGGYMFMTYSNDGLTAYLNWYDTLPYSTSQTVELGKNITDLSEKLVMNNVPTVLIPLGNTIEKIDEATPEQPADDTHILASDTANLYLVGQHLTLCNRTDVNQGLDYLTNSLTSVCGYQCETKTFDAGTAVELLAMANVYWARKILQTLFLDVDVADLHYAAGYQLTNDAIKFATNVSVICRQFSPAINTTLPCSVMDIDLDNAVKSITLGTLKRDDLSDTLKKDNDDRDYVDDDLQDQIDDLSQQIGQGGGGGGVSNVSYTPDVTSGVQLGTLHADTNNYTIYAPDAGVNMRYVPLVLADLTVDITTIPQTYVASCYDYDGNRQTGGTPVSIYIAGGDVYVPEPTILTNEVSVWRIVKNAEFRVGSITYTGFAVFTLKIPAHTAASMSSNIINNLTVTITYLIGWNKDGWAFTAQSADFTSRTNRIVFRQIIGTTGSHYYTMSPATTSGIGGVMVDGSDLSVDSQTGLISVGQDTDQDVYDDIDAILSGNV